MAPFRFWLIWLMAMSVVAVHVVYITIQFNTMVVPEEKVRVLQVIALEPKPKVRLLNQEIVLPVDRFELERSLQQLEHQLKKVAKSL